MAERVAASYYRYVGCEVRQGVLDVLHDQSDKNFIYSEAGYNSSARGYSDLVQAEVVFKERTLNKAANYKERSLLKTIGVSPEVKILVRVDIEEIPAVDKVVSVIRMIKSELQSPPKVKVARSRFDAEEKRALANRLLIGLLFPCL